jgi:hypothetical protein
VGARRARRRLSPASAPLLVVALAVLAVAVREPLLLLLRELLHLVEAPRAQPLDLVLVHVVEVLQLAVELLLLGLEHAEQPLADDIADGPLARRAAAVRHSRDGWEGPRGAAGGDASAAGSA